MDWSWLLVIAMAAAAVPPTLAVLLAMTRVRRLEIRLEHIREELDGRLSQLLVATAESSRLGGRESERLEAAARARDGEG